MVLQLTEVPLYLSLCQGLILMKGLNERLQIFFSHVAIVQGRDSSQTGSRHLICVPSVSPDRGVCCISALLACVTDFLVINPPSWRTNTWMLWFD